MNGASPLAIIVAVGMHLALCQWQFVSVEPREKSTLESVFIASYMRGREDAAFVSMPFGERVLFITPRRAEARDIALIFGIVLPIGIVVFTNLIGAAPTEPDADSQASAGHCMSCVPSIRNRTS